MVAALAARAALAAVTLAALGCSSKTRTSAGDDAPRPTTGSDGSVATDAGAGTDATTVGGVGSVEIRVEWKDVPAALRASPGRTPCNTPRRPYIAPTTTWGVPDVFVIVDGAPAVPEARVRLADCAFAPPVAVGATLHLDSGVDRPAKVTFAKRASVAHLDALEPAAPRTIQLPIAGHAVTATLESGAAYELATDARDPESTWIIAAPGAVTDNAGLATIRNIPAGPHAVTAWLPPRAGQPGRVAHGTITVPAKDVAELTLALPP